MTGFPAVFPLKPTRKGCIPKDAHTHPYDSAFGGSLWLFYDENQRSTTLSMGGGPKDKRLLTRLYHG